MVPLKIYWQEMFRRIYKLEESWKNGWKSPPVSVSKTSVLQHTIAQNRKQHQKTHHKHKTLFFFRGTANDNEKNFYHKTIDTVTMMNHITIQCIRRIRCKTATPTGYNLLTK
mmetsp:Transcript_7410/g.18150  ORF Transcript_7410/g.18150 Transcript_7410/m.18150 type:complete len:112 (-) Transcript_7410:46-381(-)